MFESSII